MNSTPRPTPALVTQRAAARLPRLVLILLCAVYVVPGVFGRDPWRNADLTAFATMLSLAEGRSSWLEPMIGGLPAHAALLPHWLGAAFIKLLPWLDAALAARIPFALLLTLTLALIWYATFHLARTEAAQPVPFAFGGEAEPIAYARALADGAVLATLATLGLLQLGHETTPELMQLSEVALLMWGLAAAPYRGWRAGLAAAAAVLALALSGAPATATALAAGAIVLSVGSSYKPARSLVPWLAAALWLAVSLSTWLGAWHWHAGPPEGWDGLRKFGKLLLWFCWPTWLLSFWTLWRWRRHLHHRHVAIPLMISLVAMIATLAMNNSDRMLLLAVPALAVLSAFALPTLKRGASAAIDWFSVFFFTVLALLIWVIYSSLQTGVPAQPMINIQRLAAGFEPHFSFIALIPALIGTCAWLWLVRWRTARNRHPVWKSMVLPAGGVSLAWLLTMTLWLEALDYARSPRAMVHQMLNLIPAGSCIQAPGLSRTDIAALEAFGRYRVDAARAAAQPDIHCPALVLYGPADQPPANMPGWAIVSPVRWPAERSEQLAVYRLAP